MQEQLESDLKAAMLAGDKSKREVLKGMKNALLYEAVNKRLKIQDLTDEQIVTVLSKESKKRSEAADLYKNAGEMERSRAELDEKKIIDAYLPEQLAEDEVAKAVDEEVAKIDSPSVKDMGMIIGAVRTRLQGQADGTLIAKLVKQAIDSQ